MDGTKFFGFVKTTLFCQSYQIFLGILFYCKCDISPELEI